MPTLADVTRETRAPTVDEFIRQALTAPAWYYFETAGQDRLAEIWSSLDSAFEDYALTKTDAAGNVLVAKATGLLIGHRASYEGDEFHGTLETKPASEVQPWECAGPYVRDEVSLLLKLWAEGFGPVRDLVDRYGLANVFSLVLIAHEKSAELQSLVRINSIVASLLAGSAKGWEAAAREAAQHIDRSEKSRRQDMSELSKKGVAARQRDAVDQDECRRLAAFYKRDNPTAKKPEVADYVKSQKPTLSKGTTMKYIAGYEEMWRKMNRPTVR